MAMADHCFKIQEAIFGISSNFPIMLDSMDDQDGMRSCGAQ